MYTQIEQLALLSVQRHRVGSIQYVDFQVVFIHSARLI